MQITYLFGRWPAIVMALVLPAFAAGCSEGSILGSEKPIAAEAAASDTLSGELPASRIQRMGLNVPCPDAFARSDTQVLPIHARGKKTAENLRYQGSIREIAAECVRGADGGVLVRVGVAGRVIAGPKGGPGTVTLPIRVAFVRDGSVLYSKLFKQQVILTELTLSQSYTLLVENIPHSEPDAGAGQIYVGFDSR